MTLLILLEILISFSYAHGSVFQRTCSENSNIKYHYENLFKIQGCEAIEKKLSTLTSFSEFLIPDRKRSHNRKILGSPWTDDFPYMYGLNKRILEDQFLVDPLGLASDKISTLDIFKQFKNLTDISYLPEYAYYSKPKNICKILGDFPSIRTVTIQGSLLHNKEADRCLSKLKEGVIIRDEFRGQKHLSPKSNIIGIEYYTGEFQRLENLKGLRYLGISNKSNTLNGIEAIYKLSKLSHFSMNIASSIPDIEKLTFLRDLEYLNITCKKNESLNLNTNNECVSDSAIINIEFISDMVFLRHLNLSNNSISDIHLLANLSDLEYLKLRGNRISDIPNFSALKKLRFLDLSGNEISSLQNLDKIPHIYFLNLAGNNITDGRELYKMKALAFLNLANNPKLFFTNNKEKLENLKALNIDESKSDTELSSHMGLKEFDIDGYEHERYLIYETLYVNYPKRVTPNQICATNTSPRNITNLDSFPNLEILSMRNNNLKTIPEISNMKQLKYLNLGSNHITNLSSTDLPNTIIDLNFTNNNFSSFPDIAFLKKLIRISFSQNLISNIDNVKTTPDTVFILNLANNLIRNATNLDEVHVLDDFHLRIYLANNIIPQDAKYCPIGFSTSLRKNCSMYVRGETRAIGPQRKVIPGETDHELFDRIKSYQCK